MVYTFDNYVRAWVRSAFGVFAAFAVYYALNSAFLGVLTFAFLFFIPLSDRNTETTTNRIIFCVLMFVLIFWAF